MNTFGVKEASDISNGANADHMQIPVNATTVPSWDQKYAGGKSSVLWTRLTRALLVNQFAYSAEWKM
jgi:hypothetical protein